MLVLFVYLLGDKKNLHEIVGAQKSDFKNLEIKHKAADLSKYFCSKTEVRLSMAL